MIHSTHSNRKLYLWGEVCETAYQHQRMSAPFSNILVSCSPAQLFRLTLNKYSISILRIHKNHHYYSAATFMYVGRFYWFSLFPKIFFYFGLICWFWILERFYLYFLLASYLRYFYCSYYLFFWAFYESLTEDFCARSLRFLFLLFWQPSKVWYSQFFGKLTGMDLKIRSNPPTCSSLPSNTFSKSTIVKASSSNPHFNLKSN